MNAVIYLVAAAAGYLLGSLPFGYLVARWNGVNIFEVGSRNPGATNVKRCVGKRAGNLVFALDCLKGIVATSWVRLLPVSSDAVVWLGLLGFASAMCGHIFPLFTGFREGKGVATMFGGTVALMPVGAIIGAAVWVLFFYSTRYVSVASICLALSLPVSVFFLHGTGVLFWFALLVAAFVVFRHRENIIRLFNGTESRFLKKKAVESGGSH